MIDLKEIRKEAHLTQTQLASKLGIKQQQYSRYEIEENQVPLKMFLKILEICNYEFKIKKKTSHLQTNRVSL